MFLVNQLCGFGAGGAEGLMTLTQVASGTSTNADGSITSSATIMAGDLLVVYGFSSRIIEGTSDFPPGFTSAVTIQNTTGSKQGIYYKIATGSEGTSVTGFAASGSSPSATNLLYVFRGNIQITSVLVGSGTFQATVADPAAQVVGSSGGVAPLIVVAGYRVSISGTVDTRMGGSGSVSVVRRSRSVRCCRINSVSVGGEGTNRSRPRGAFPPPTPNG
jgi:hypothetical protein